MVSVPPPTRHLKTLRARSVREVKQTNGRISFKDAIDYQRGVE